MFWNGPFELVHQLSPVLFSCQNLISKEIKTVHAQRLILYKYRKDGISLSELEQAAYNAHESEYEVEDLLDFKNGNYLVKWLGFEETTWEPASTIEQDVPQLVKKFLKGMKRGL